MQLLDRSKALVVAAAWSAIGLLAGLGVEVSSAMGQSSSGVPTEKDIKSQPGQTFMVGRDGKVYRIGDACIRKSDQKPGVVKRDACARWYCSLPDAQDIIELRPNIAAEMNCVWRLYGTHCRCGPRDAADKKSP
ncbi:MAG TPA: hypothetical protein VLX09_12895 [Stellaceae bacterium]|nr:hypothetical protein [Xanthobacteraceae bacterium]HUK08762.1 hypothetical protein [Stellaceae bacterium]